MPMPLKASVAFFSFPSDNPPETRQFFQNLFGIDFVPALSEEVAYHAPVSDAGLDVNVTSRHTPQESPTAFIAVDDLDAAINVATSSGGRIVWGPSSLAIPSGDFAAYKKAIKELNNVDITDSFLAHAAIVVEPGGSQVGLVQLADSAQKHYNAGKYRQPLSDYRLKQHQLSGDTAKTGWRN